MDGNRYRTQLYLDEAQYLFLKESAAKYNTSIAGMVRNLIDREMGGGESVKEDDPLFRMAPTAVRTGRSDGSIDHDRYIYRQQPNRSGRQGVTKKDGGKSR